MNKISITLLCLLVSALSLAQDFICPVMGNPIPKEGGSSVQYSGLLLQFCCDGCDDTFLKEPEKYLAKSAESEKPVATGVFDPVSQTRVNKETAKGQAVFNGVLYYFQSEANLAEFQALPGIYITRPTKKSLVCPAMKNTIASYADAYGYGDFEGVRYYFCCGGCDKDFRESPAKFARTVAEHVKPVSGAKADASTAQMMPTCAGCAGEARMLLGGEMGHQFVMTYRFVGIDDPKAQHRFTLDYAVTPNFSVGIERSGSDSRVGPNTTLDDGFFDYLRYSDGDATILPRFSWFITPEKGWAPSLVFGAASDRLSTPRGQAFFLTAGHSIPGTKLFPFVSVKTNSFDGKTVFPFGLNIGLDGGYVIQAINDGDYSHFLFTKMMDHMHVSLLLARSEYIGFVVAVGF